MTSCTPAGRHAPPRVRPWTSAHRRPPAPGAGGPAPHHEHEVWRHRHVLDVDDFTIDEIELVMATTAEMKEILSRPIKKVPTLRGTSVTIIFWEASTRTRGSFEVAAKNLSADVVNIAAQA